VSPCRHGFQDHDCSKRLFRGDAVMWWTETGLLATGLVTTPAPTPDLVTVRLASYSYRLVRVPRARLHLVPPWGWTAVGA
jgi:hypothetical protein